VRLKQKYGRSFAKLVAKLVDDDEEKKDEDEEMF
jgi:hypothetical protein